MHLYMYMHVACNYHTCTRDRACRRKVAAHVQWAKLINSEQHKVIRKNEYIFSLRG